MLVFQATETLFRMAVTRGFVRPVKHGEVSGKEKNESFICTKLPHSQLLLRPTLLGSALLLDFFALHVLLQVRAAHGVFFHSFSRVVFLLGGLGSGFISKFISVC